MGWRGSGTFRFASQAAPGGGKQSLFVSGACTVPHAYFELPAFPTDGYYLLRCWGKDLGIGGAVLLRIKHDPSGHFLSIAVNRPEWTFYESPDTLFCPAGKSLEVELMAGGFVSSAMLIDLLEIRRIK